MDSHHRSGITVRVLCGNQQQEIFAQDKKYHSLMDLISQETDLIGFGLCNGMRSCGTCQVLINGHAAYACEVAVNTLSDGALITIDNSEI